MSYIAAAAALAVAPYYAITGQPALAIGMYGLAVLNFASGRGWL